MVIKRALKIGVMDKGVMPGSPDLRERERERATRLDDLHSSFLSCSTYITVTCIG